jgi:hypothetical protein
MDFVQIQKADCKYWYSPYFQGIEYYRWKVQIELSEDGDKIMMRESSVKIWKVNKVLLVAALLLL